MALSIILYTFFLSIFTLWLNCLIFLYWNIKQYISQRNFTYGKFKREHLIELKYHNYDVHRQDYITLTPLDEVSTVFVLFQTIRLYLTSHRNTFDKTLHDYVKYPFHTPRHGKKVGKWPKKVGINFSWCFQ